MKMALKMLSRCATSFTITFNSNKNELLWTEKVRQRAATSDRNQFACRHKCFHYDKIIILQEIITSDCDFTLAKQRRHSISITDQNRETANGDFSWGISSVWISNLFMQFCVLCLRWDDSKCYCCRWNIIRLRKTTEKILSRQRAFSSYSFRLEKIDPNIFHESWQNVLLTLFRSFCGFWDNRIKLNVTGYEQTSMGLCVCVYVSDLMCCILPSIPQPPIKF